MRTEDGARSSRYRSPARMFLEGIEGMVLLGLVGASWPISRRWLDNLGSSPDELGCGWPGDELLDCVDEVHTRGISIDAPVSRVWPWLHQFGLDRGGFFSYELLENLLGWRVKNIERLVPDLEPLQIDDGVILAPGEPAIWLSLLEEERHLCFRTWRDERFLADHDPAVIASWSMYLVPAGERSCRLLLRSCKQRRRKSSLASRGLRRFLEDPLDFVMEQRMLRTLRRLAEASVKGDRGKATDLRAEQIG